MAIEIKKKEGEPVAGLVYRFTKKVRQSGVIKEVRKRQFRKRDVNKRKRRLSAKHRDQKKAEMIRLRKLGLV
jgi:ribosomal protein S21